MKALHLSVKIALVALSFAFLVGCGEEEVPPYLDHANCCGESSWGPAPQDSLLGQDGLLELDSLIEQDPPSGRGTPAD